MKYSKLFSKTSKTIPHDADSANAKFLVQGGFIHRETAGVYSYLPMGLKVLRKIEQIIREEIEAIGGQEILMPVLTPKENWVTTEDGMDLMSFSALKVRGIRSMPWEQPMKRLSHLLFSIMFFLTKIFLQRFFRYRTSSVMKYVPNQVFYAAVNSA